MEELELITRHLTLGLSIVVEIVAAAVIAAGTLQAIYHICRSVVRRDRALGPAVRLQYGRWLVLSLEFLVAADILRTAVAPSWNEIGQLGAIIVLRTLLSFALDREIEKVERKTEAHAVLTDQLQKYH